MRGNCSIKDCKSEGMTVKIHEDFEFAATDNDINICWECGDKLLKAINEDTTHLVEPSDSTIDTTGTE